MLLVRLAISCCVLISLLSSTGFAQEPDDKLYPKEVYFDFRGKELPGELMLMPEAADRFVKSEPEGLRISLPRDRKDLAPVEVRTRFGVQGDFEITATLEILQAERPIGGFGVGASLFLNKLDPPTEGTTFGRLSRADGEDIVFWDQGFGKPGQGMQFEFDSRPCTDRQLRLRLKRTGSQMAYLLGTDLKGEKYEELSGKNFGLNDIERVLVRVTTGRQPCSVDVRLIDLRIRSGRTPDAKDVVAVEARGVRSRTSLVFAMLVGLGIAICVAVALGIWAYRRRRRPAGAGS